MMIRKFRNLLEKKGIEPRDLIMVSVALFVLSSFVLVSLAAVISIIAG